MINYLFLYNESGKDNEKMQLLMPYIFEQLKKEDGQIGE